MCQSYLSHQWRVAHPAHMKVWRDSTGRQWYRVAVVCTRCGTRDVHFVCQGKREEKQS